MASNKQMLLLAAAAAVAVAVAFLPALAAAAGGGGTEHWVGDDKGWTLGFNYTAWAQTKQFKVGDTLVFKYSPPTHTVVEVDGAGFAACSTPDTAKVLATGQDHVALDSPGRRWFVCSVGKHCANGMKVKIDVLAATAVSPVSSLSPVSPPPSSPAANVQARLAQAVLAVAAVAAVLVL